MKASAETLAQSLAPEHLQLILLTTEACNFRCTYCYEDFALARMKPWVVRGVKNLLHERSPELSSLHLSWFGGEPLLARDIVIELMEHAQALAREHPGMQVHSDITTNAWFLERPLFERLVGLGITRYQISFDGPRECHDRKRKLAGGRGTFDRIWANVLAMREVPGEFEIAVRIHVDAENAAALPEFLDQCRAAFAGDARFVPFLKPLSRYGGPNDGELAVLEGPAGARTLAELERQLHGPAAAPGHPVCYASKGNSYIVRADGRLSKCTVALSHPRNVVGRIHEDGRMEIEAPPMQAWMRGLWSGKRQQLLCPMIGLAEPAPAREEALARG